MSSSAKQRSLAFAVAAGTAGLLAVASAAHATTGTWIGPTSSNWSNAAAWQDGIIPNAPGDTAQYDAAGGSQITLQDSAAGVTVGTFRLFGDGNSSWQIRPSGGNVNLNNNGAGVTVWNDIQSTSSTSNPAIFFNNNAGGVFVVQDNILLKNTSNSTRTSGSIQIQDPLVGNGNIRIENISNDIGHGQVAFTNDESSRGSRGGNVTIASGATTFTRGDIFTPTPGIFVTIGDTGMGNATLAAVGNGLGGIENNIVSAPNTGGTNVFASRPLNGTADSTNNVTIKSTNTNAAFITLNGDLTFDNRNTAGSVFIIGDPITGVGKATFTGVGAKEIENTGSYYGGTVLNQGSLKVHHVDAFDNGFGHYDATNGTLGSGDVTIAAGASHLEISPANWPSAANPINVIADTAAVSIADGTQLMLDSGTTASTDNGGQPITVNETIGGLVLGGVTQTVPGTYGSSSSGAQFQDDAHFSGPGMVTLVLGRTLYWDTNSITPGAGGATPSGTWDNTAAGTTFNTDSTGAGGGTITAQSLSTDPVVFTAGSDGTGSYTVTVNGTQNAASVSIPRGNVTFTGGTIGTPSIDVASGATATVSSQLAGSPSTGSVTKTGPGSLTVTSGQSYTGGTTVSGGTMVAGHSAAFANGALDVADGATAQVQPGLANAVVVTTLNTHSTGQMDVTNGSMVIRGSTAAAVRAQIVSGFNGGAWNGPGINSSAAASDANGLTAIGYASNADYGATDFKGVSGLTANDVLLRYTYYGDADLDGQVTLDDFSQFLNGYQLQSAATNNWLNGDFDYDGAVTLDDFSQFLFGYQHQGAPLGALESMIDSSSLSSSDKALMLAAVEAVPEPTGLALLGLAGAGLLARRRRRQA